ncbi:hypothetical protein B0J15DRAFT_242917 [Fusarium solani]|uniref:Bacteriophage T5 Orf172 DNA-binding domain-containing protein n=1 Tax=Fusarium solani TaxID=169388 RepID=A0A9P9HZY1_FUSSL|nr:uncharacterized protein B0J15DRAFT_242917 [Fusarium solani]KAH7266273.1 hypothetical protein B0J15DRAFT_242917 [Fusarium solani]
MNNSTPTGLEDLASIIDFLPSLENPDLTRCRGENQKRVKCSNPILAAKRLRAPPLWADLANREYFPDNEDFYYKLKTLLECIHCNCHVGDAFERYRSWKMERSLDAASFSSESSVPGTPEQRSSIEFPSDTDITPFSSPLTMDDTPKTPKSSSSDAAESFIQSTPTRSTTTSLRFPKETERLGTVEVVSKRISTMTITADTEKSTCNTSGTVVENFSAMAISSRELPQKSQEPATEQVAVEHVSTVAIAVSEETSTTKTGEKEATQDVRVVGLGLISTLQRKGSLRDDSPVIRELHKHLTPQQLEEGIVYVLEHTGTPGLFKVGWTRTSVYERLGQPGNCYGKHTKVLHETSSGRFAGASKAERLVQVILRHQNIEVVECEQCGGGHKEWFRSSKDEVLRTVKLMEDFVQLPAYERCEGEMKLSREANAFVKAMCNFSTARLESIMARPENSVKETVESTSSVGTQGSASEAPVEQSAQEPLRSEENPSSSTSRFSDRSRPPRISLATKLGTRGNKVKVRAANTVANTKERFGRLFNRSRESTPELEDASSTDKSNADANTSKGPEELLVKFLWSLLPEDSKPDQGVTGDDGPRDMAALKTVVRQMADDFRKDFEAAYEGTDNTRGNDGDSKTQ